jgi:hypothetical protein
MRRTAQPPPISPVRVAAHFAKAAPPVRATYDALLLTLKADHRVTSPRVHRAEQTSANRWHLELRLRGPEEVDAEVRALLAQAYDLA